MILEQSREHSRTVRGLRDLQLVCMHPFYRFHLFSILSSTDSKCRHGRNSSRSIHAPACPASLLSESRLLWVTEAASPFSLRKGACRGKGREIGGQLPEQCTTSTTSTAEEHNAITCRGQQDMDRLQMRSITGLETKAASAATPWLSKQYIDFVKHIFLE